MGVKRATEHEKQPGAHAVHRPRGARTVWEGDSATRNPTGHKGLRDADGFLLYSEIGDFDVRYFLPAVKSLESTRKVKIT